MAPTTDQPTAAQLDIARRAIVHVLRRMRTEDRLYALMGNGTEAFSLLTQAYSELSGEDLETVRKQLRSKA